MSHRQNRQTSRPKQNKSRYDSDSSESSGSSGGVDQQTTMMPPRGTAFQAPLVNLAPPKPPPDPEADEGLKFSFEPKANYRTEISFTVEPRKAPAWQTMMRCGFVPMIPAQVPPYSIGNYVSHPLTIQNPPAFHYTPSTFPPSLRPIHRPSVPPHYRPPRLPQHPPPPPPPIEECSSDDESDSGEETSPSSSSSEESSDEDCEPVLPATI